MPINPTDSERKLINDALTKVMDVLVTAIPEVNSEVTASWDSLVYRLNAIENKQNKTLVATALCLKLQNFIKIVQRREPL